jgi:hypothetical protein
MEHDYRIDSLASTFAEHAEMAIKHQENINRIFIENNPGQELPDHMSNPFNIAKALSVMASEIEKLKTSR